MFSPVDLFPSISHVMSLPVLGRRSLSLLSWTSSETMSIFFSIARCNDAKVLILGLQYWRDRFNLLVSPSSTPLELNCRRPIMIYTSALALRSCLGACWPCGRGVGSLLLLWRLDFPDVSATAASYSDWVYSSWSLSFESWSYRFIFVASHLLSNYFWWARLCNSQISSRWSGMLHALLNHGCFPSSFIVKQLQITFMNRFYICNSSHIER